MSKDQTTDENSNVSRRNFLTATAAGVAALSTLPGCATVAASSSTASCANGKPTVKAPFNDFRSYIESLEQHGLVIRLPRLDQDEYEMTAMMYRLIEEYGWEEAPALVVDEVKIDGKWVKGPVVANHHGHYHAESIVFGLDPVPGNPRASYRQALDYLTKQIKKGAYPEIDPVEVSADQALCKEVVLTGDDIDLNQFAYIQSNPRDGGRYVNTGSTFTYDEKIGLNIGTYRCQIQGKNILSVNPEPNQTAWRTFMAAKERGESTVPLSIVCGQDPYIWIVSGSRVVNRVLRRGKVSELAVAGGLKGSAIEVVKSETNDLLVPAGSEMIIEGYIDFNQSLPEGPFGEMMGYMGPQKSENFVMVVTAITHRKDPWVLNQFTGVTRGYVTGPVTALTNLGLKRLVPEMIEIHNPLHAPGITYVRIKKTKPGQGLKAGEKLAKLIPIYKFIVVVDEDVDVLDQIQVDNAIATRMQPETASTTLMARGMPLDPSLVHREGYSAGKLIVDATKQWPEEGGPAIDQYAVNNRAWLDELAPNAIKRVDKKYGHLIQKKDTFC